MALAPFYSRDVWLIKMCSILGNRIAIWTWTNMKPNEWFFECGCFCWFTPISDVMTVRAAFQVVWDIKVRLCLHNLSLILSIRPMRRRDIDKSNLCFFFTRLFCCWASFYYISIEIPKTTERDNHIMAEER